MLVKREEATYKHPLIVEGNAHSIVDELQHFATLCHRHFDAPNSVMNRVKTLKTFGEQLRYRVQSGRLFRKLVWLMKPLTAQ